MPHINFLEQDKAVNRVVKDWERTPEYVNQLCRAIKYEADRRKDESTPRPEDISAPVWSLWSKWLMRFGLAKARESAEMLSDKMFPKARIKK